LGGGRGGTFSIFKGKKNKKCYCKVKIGRMAGGVVPLFLPGCATAKQLYLFIIYVWTVFSSKALMIRYPVQDHKLGMGPRYQYRIFVWRAPALA